jgi:hypothetical protein
MSDRLSWLADFNLGEYLGIGLDSRQIGSLAGAVFLALLGLSAARRAKHASGLVTAIWIAVAIGLCAGAFHVAVRGFSDLMPEWLRPWAEPDRLARAAAVVALVIFSLVLVSAHWVTGSMSRFAHRLGGLATAGVAVWLAAGWFAADIPDEVRGWTARTVLVRVGIVAGLVALGIAFWTRQGQATPHVRWLNRTLTPPALAIAVLLAVNWFGLRVWPELPIADVERATYVIGAVGTGTCLLVASGAFLMRERTAKPRPTHSRLERVDPPPVVSLRPLPVAVLLDDGGRPVLPAQSGQSGTVGA